MNRSRWSFVFVAGLLLIPVHSQSAGRKPPRYGDKVSVSKAKWIKNETKRSIQVATIEEKNYLKASEVARISGSQLRWHSAAEKACLSLKKEVLCFKWAPPKFTMNGKKIETQLQPLFHDNQLFVPIEFLTSSEFEKFSQHNLAWNNSDWTLTQSQPATLFFPPVENLGDQYQVTVEFTPGTPYKILEHTNRRIWIRFEKGRFSKSQILRGDKTVREVRISQKRRGADFVVKLGRSADCIVNQLDDEGKIIIQVPVKGAGDIAAVLATGKTVQPISTKTPKRKVPLKPDKSVRTIVIDAGHGGLDSGAIGTRGTLEKTINLKVAKSLAKELNKKPGVRAVLTRDKDAFLALGERTGIANQLQADLFVSIHCNSSINSKATGFEVYFLSPEATDEAAAAVARIENSVIHLEKKNGVKSDKVEELLASLAINNFINESSECSAHICRGIKAHSPINKTAVKEANFYVLRGAQMPGVLVELEFLSNPLSENKLRSARFRSQITKGIAKGIMDYGRTTWAAFQAVASTSDANP